MKVAMVVTTYFPPGEAGALRLETTKKTLSSWFRLFSPKNLAIYIEDDGSSPEYLDAIHSFAWSSSSWSDVSLDFGDRQGVGASLNRGFEKAFTDDCVAFYGVDDWGLTAPFDLAPWVKTLEQHEEYGCIRLGPPHPNLTGRIDMVEEGWLLKLDRYGYTAAQRPALWHERFFEAYGWWPENCSALECERIFNERFTAAGGSVEIGLALPVAFDHNYGVELSALDPRERPLTLNGLDRLDG